EEVQHVVAGGMLAAELEAVGALAEVAPEEAFGKGLGLAESASADRRFGGGFGEGVFEHWVFPPFPRVGGPLTPPPSALRMVPLPETSSGRFYSAASVVRVFSSIGLRYWPV